MGDDGFVDVCIIGAGIAGLSCALELIAKDRTVAVVEARNRVGGRTLSEPLPGGTVDVGGQWLAPGQDRMLRLVDDLGLELNVQPWFQAMEASKDDPLLRSGAENTLTATERDELRIASTHLDGLARVLRPPPWKPAEVAHNETLDAMSVADYIRANCGSDAVAEELRFFVCNTLACEPDRVSLLFFLEMVRSCGGLWRLGDGSGGAQSYTVKGGAGQIAQLMSRRAESLGVQLVLGSPVSRVVQDEGGVLVFKDGQVAPIVRARRVVVAMAPTLWKHLAFEPALAKVRTDLANNMFMGSVVKVISIYGAPFWRQTPASGDIEDFGPVYNVFPGRVGNLHALVGFVSAREAVNMQGFTSDDIRDAVTKQYARYFKNAEALRPAHFICKNWAEERFSGGCFEAIPPPRFGVPLALYGGAPSGLLHFASTEIGPTWKGYMEGAIGAGEKAAAEVDAAITQGGGMSNPLVGSRTGRFVH